MKVVCDIETNGLVNPDKIWVIVCKDIETKKIHTFTNVHERPDSFKAFAANVTVWIGHNFLAYDLPQLVRLVDGLVIHHSSVIDTLVVSRLLDYSRPGGHSLEQYGSEFNYPKVLDIDFSKFDDRMIERCTTDVEINYKLYLKQKPYIESPKWKGALRLEHEVATLCNTLSTNGFYFNSTNAKVLLASITNSLSTIDTTISTTFSTTSTLLREVHPKVTSFGTLNRKDFRGESDLSLYNGGPFSRIKWVKFNAGSPKQVTTVLNAAGWKPIDKTKGHIELERELSRLSKLDLISHPLYPKLVEYKKYGYKINEKNLETLPESAPEGARLLAKRILLESRRKTLQEWVDLCNPHDNRIHGQFNHIGAWTMRMSHTNPNTANIPRDDKLYGGEMRSLWCVPEDSFLVGVDAEGIQLRVLAHYIDDKEFTYSVTQGKKQDATDPHSLNKRILGSVCKSRDDAKTFIYAWLLGAGITKISEILKCSEAEAKEANQRFIDYFENLKKLKEEVIPKDAQRGFFQGFDGRYVKIWGDEEGLRRHLCLAGYLQCGEAVIMKKALVKWHKQLTEEKVPFKLVNFVHDEWQIQVDGDYDTALYVANIVAESIKWAGEELNLRCPMQGSILGGHGKIAIGHNWLETH